jgi:YaiO family outer membrane protein
LRRIIFVFIIIFYALFFSAKVLTAQEIKWRNHRIEASYSYEYLDPRNAYGDWHTLNLALYTEVSPTFTYFVEGALFNRNEDNGIAGTVGAYKYWSSWLDTYSALSIGSNSEYWHRFRADHDFNFKVGTEKFCVLTAGATYINYSTDRYDFIVSGGPKFYFLDKWVFEYRLFYNISYPGAINSFSHLISLGYGQDYQHWTYLNVSFGKEAYLENSPDPERAYNDSLEVALKHRHWLGKHYGVFGEVSYFKLKNEYDKYGVTCGVFYEF